MIKIIKLLEKRETQTRRMRNRRILPLNLRSKEIRETNILDSVAMLENLEK